MTVNTAIWTPAVAGSQGTSAAQCVVDGSMAPVDKSPSARPINFRVVLPASWNHRAVHRGGGGMNGVIPQMTDADLGPGYVRYGSDSGHQMSFAGRRWPRCAGRRAETAAPGGSENDWATNDEAIKNLAYMQLKKTHDAAFFIVERIYGERPRFSYFVGTSQGGREALTVVQRYPADYDGVVVDGPHRELHDADAGAGAHSYSREGAGQLGARRPRPPRSVPSSCGSATASTDWSTA